MDVIGQIKLNYTEDFRIACKINNLKQEELLQYFIDHVSFYAFIGGDMDPAYLWATTVSIDCKDVLGSQVEAVTDKRIQDISLKYIKKLTALNLETDLSRDIECKKSIALMNEWSGEMLSLTNYVNKAEETSLTGPLSLSFDFNLVCGMNGISTENQLQYFIDNISLAKDRAVNLLQTVKIDPSTAVLLFLISNHEGVKNKILPHQEIYKKYCLLLLKLDKKQKEESSLENRIHNYSAFYLDWYNALNEE